MDKKTAIPEIKKLAESGTTQNSLEGIFAKCYNAVKKTLDITPFDEQLSAALSLAEGRMVQMQTGEGKTLCAVFAACYEVLREGGGHVHILTFNDYLAQRDCEWMKPVYNEMGVSVGCITESTPRNERKALYESDVVYITAKEAGFDYLRDFVCTEPSEMVFPEKLNFAIFDEADSLLIDEARIPLVIAGDIAVDASDDVSEVYAAVADFNEEDFEYDEDSRNVYLTDLGADKAEIEFGCNIYDEECAPLLAKICACLKAREYLAENKDYIVRDGRIVLIDEFTGRAAVGRVFPGELQAAAEAKHNLKITERGRIMGNIALQYFARLYPKLSGMTGTAEDSREEFEKFYGILTDVIPTRLPLARVDKPLELYYDKTEKRKAILAAIEEAHSVGRPVLVGSESIEESESIAADLAIMDIPCSVLNAKNNTEEAAIIADAGKLGAVTISTNMAGRGVDIKLGGADCSAEDKAAVTAVGGLLVLATSMRESSRITKQLRGRAGRQGDVGESRFFAALDDEIMIKNDLRGLAGRHYPSAPVEGAIEDKALLREAERVQRISEGDAFDERVNLMKYTLIGEKHREITFGKRLSLLEGTYNSEFWQKNAPDLYEKAKKLFPESEIQALQNKILALMLNEFHSEYLDYSGYLREGIHLTQIAGRNPAEEYNIACEEYYIGATAEIPDRMCQKLETLLEVQSIEKFPLNAPTRTYTYLLNDMGEEFKAKPILLGMFEDYEEGAQRQFGGSAAVADNPDNADNSKTEDTEQAEQAEKKKGFFSRLFGKKK